MTGMEMLEDLAKDCEQCALDAQVERNEGEKRAWLSVAYRIRFAARQLCQDQQLKD